MKPSGSKEKGQVEEKRSNATGIQSFFQRTDNGDRVTPEAAKIPPDFVSFEDPTLNQVKVKPAVPRKVMTPVLKVVDPPPFHPVRATATDETFLDRLKVREFVLKCALLPLPPIDNS